MQRHAGRIASTAGDGRPWWLYSAIVAAAVVAVTAARTFVEEHALRWATQAACIVGAIVALKLASDLIV